MSHAEGKIKLENGNEYYYEYNGTSDVLCTRMYKTNDELHDKDNWRGDNHRECNDDSHKKLKGAASTNYGAGWHHVLDAEVCEQCMAITGRTVVYDDYGIYGDE